MEDTSSGVKKWKCPNGHVMGLVERVSITLADGRTGHVSRLMLYRQAIDSDADRQEDVDVVAAIEGTALEIRCSVCEEVRPWYIGADAIERLLLKVNGGIHANQDR